MREAARGAALIVVVFAVYALVMLALALGGTWVWER